MNDNYKCPHCDFTTDQPGLAREHYPCEGTPKDAKPPEIPIKYKVWIQIEEVDEEQDSCANVGLPDRIGTYTELVIARAVTEAILFLTNPSAIVTSHQLG